MKRLSDGKGEDATMDPHGENLSKTREKLFMDHTISRPKIIAVDFDGCLVEDRYPEIGRPHWKVIGDLRLEQEQGAKIILWTCRRGLELNAAVEWCDLYGIDLDAVNENLPEMIEFFGEDTRKIFADEYWDDRAVRMGNDE